MTGWVKLHRQIRDWEWYGDANTRGLFLHLLISVNHEPSRFRGHVVPAGSIVSGRKSLADSLGISEQNVRTALDKLKSTNEITIKTTTKFSIISITNWEKYQDANQQTNQRLTNDQPTTNHILRMKECKNSIGGKSQSPAKQIGYTWLTDETKVKWDEFVQMRTDIGKPISARGQAMALKELDSLLNEGFPPFNVLDQSIKKRWQGVFKLAEGYERWGVPLVWPSA